MIRVCDLRIFVAAAEEENFSRAAEKLHLSQPAVSQAIRTFEQALGTELFLRHGRSVRLSAAGEVLLPMAREALVSILRIEDTMTGIQGKVLGELAIGCTTSSGKRELCLIKGGRDRAHQGYRIRVGSLRYHRKCNCPGPD